MTGRPSVSTSSQESLDIMIAKLARARAIDRGEVIEEEEESSAPTQEPPRSGPILGNSNTKTCAPY